MKPVRGPPDWLKRQNSIYSRYFIADFDNPPYYATIFWPPQVGPRAFRNRSQLPISTAAPAS
jgi:hypothetical protein